jgi:pilus assembly protein Flp/PilA
MTDLVAKFFALLATRGQADPLDASRPRPARLDDKGATAVEYGLMVALIAVVIIAAVTLLGDNLAGMFDAVAGEVEDATPGS